MSAPDYRNAPALPDFVLQKVPTVDLVMDPKESAAQGERFLKSLLGEIEIAEEADERGEHPARFGAVDRLDQVCDWLNSMIGRTSTVPCFAPGMRDATCTASLRSLALIM